MMAEVIDHFHAARFAAHFLPPRDSPKALQRILDLRFRHIVEASRGRGHRRIAHIELADQRNFVNVIAQFETRATGRIRNVADPLRTVLRKTDLDHLRQTILCDLDTVVIVAINQDHSVLRNDVEQPLKAELDLVEVLENVGVIELDVVYDH